MTQRNIDPAAALWVIQALGRLICTFAILIGVLIIVGGDERFSGPSYASALAYPGAPESWGVFIGLAGVVGLASSLLGRLTPIRLSLYTIAAWTFFFAWSIIHSALENPNAGLTGGAIYPLVGLVAILVGVVHQRVPAGS